jgi:hypothetical protein
VAWFLEPTSAAADAVAADVPEVAEGIYEKLRTQWLKLQKHSDQVRGTAVFEVRFEVSHKCSRHTAAAPVVTQHS